ncbi:hypothetical protein Aspvir_007033 [Aspergillus viridinutans]|uniref:Uncharacterized protein n=1 Tax=Aspergillus viridinutans TaxID=75553 RepID=A0A9P3F6D6_ASPVI|nr:uncharacterized protein Aspvir_007033 [Aspergillus viridinutans]GIK02968.1 hypothetical protein Aspvir_007033 [Aspergillus viridinutans]
MKHTAKFHLLIPSHSALVIDHLVVFHDNLLPLTVTGQSHRYVDSVWFNLRRKQQELHLKCVGAFESREKIVTQAGILGFVACWAGCTASSIAADRRTYGNGSSTLLGCSWPSDHPTDTNARVGLVIDEELGFVVTSGIVPGKVYPYQNISAFIPDKMTSAQDAQVEYLEAMKAKGTEPLLSPIEATGDTLEVLQYYNDKLQAMQINVYLSGPNMTSPWL